MSDTIVLALTSIIVAVIGAAATIGSSLIGRGKKTNSEAEKLYIPEGYKAARSSGWKPGWRAAVLLLCFLVIGLASGALLSARGSEGIQFASMFRPHILRSSLGWDAGSSELSTYTLDGDTLHLTAGPHSWPNFPMVQYERSIRGDFTVQVKITFMPEAAMLETAQMAGILVRPANTRLAQNETSFPADWIVTGKYVTDAGILVGCRGSWAEDISEVVFLRVEKAGASWKCAYSHNGENWTYLNTNMNGQPPQDQPLIVSLFAYTDTEEALTVRFSDWIIREGK